MNDLSLLDCLQPESSKLERVNYFQRMLLATDDMKTEQDYFRQKQRRHNRYLHGWGTVCGLDVVAAPTTDFPWRVRIEPGYALGPYGDEIYVAKPVHLDLAKCGPEAATDPCEPDLLHNPNESGITGDVFVAIKYAECKARPVRAMPAGCGCDETACEYSRIRDSFQIECLTELPPSPPRQILCDLISGKRLPACPPCPTDPWVVLAKVTLQASPITPIEEGMIDNITFRRQIYSTAILQEQIIACCCKKNIRVANVRLLKTLRDGSDSEIFNWETALPNPEEAIQIDMNANALATGNAIEITFTEAVNPIKVVNGKTFVIRNSQGVEQHGEITFTAPGVMRWEGSTLKFSNDEEFMVTLLGESDDAIQSIRGSRLDGEPKRQLPSGDDQEGGNFVFRFQVVNIIL